MSAISIKYRIFIIYQEISHQVYYMTGSLGSVSSQGTLYSEAPSKSSDVVTW